MQILRPLPSFRKPGGMLERGTRWRDLPDGQRARQMLIIVFWSAVVMLYILGGFSLVLRNQFLKPTESSPATTNAPSPTSGPTLFPTLTPSP